ncbi:MAG: gamma-glutamyltransferase [Planctomycetota bacterium]|nr:gamma-glutamyltransferase [Planctomycetota bacterium]
MEYASENPVLDASGEEHTCFLSESDFAEWHPSIEQTTVIEYKGLQVHKCGPWTQGPVFLQQLQILRNFDLPAMGHNSARYVHTLLETAKLAFADREAHYGDPDFHDVPLQRLLDPDYGAQRAKLISDTPAPGIHPGTDNRKVHHIEDVKADAEYSIRHGGDTTQLVTADSSGMMVCATPSGGWIRSNPVISAVGFALTTRGQMFYLNPHRPNCYEPRKRPRITLTPSMVTREGEPYLAFGTPGGDAQDQTTLQFFLNVVEFGMDMQSAVEAPSFYCEAFANSFYPRGSFERRFAAEDRLGEDILSQLKEVGHRPRLLGDWGNGCVMGIRFDENGLLTAAASPRREVALAFGR